MYVAIYLYLCEINCKNAKIFTTQKNATLNKYRKLHSIGLLFHNVYEYLKHANLNVF